MILIDSSAWIQALREPNSIVFRRTEEIIEQEACTCGVIIQEVLQGIHDLKVLKEIRMRFWTLPYLETTRETYVAAAHLFQRCRSRGIQVHTVDTLIMALAIQHTVPVFAVDADFVRVASMEPDLRLYP